jgi:branched-subunit amino acid transport protein
MNTWLAVVLVGLGSCALRLAPPLFAQRFTWPDPVDRGLRHAGTAALVYLVVAPALGEARVGWPQAAGVAAGMLVGLALALRGHRAIAVIAAGLGGAWLVTLAAGLIG